MFLSQWHEFRSVPCLAGKKHDDSPRLDVVEIAHVHDVLPSLFPSWSGKGLISTPVIMMSVSTASRVIISAKYRRKTLSGLEPSFMCDASLSVSLGPPVYVCATLL